jgi:molecular chaperone DnaJ
MSKKVKNYYNILGLTKDASPEEIKKTFKDLAKKYHPDKNMGDKISEDKFKEINEAYECLSDPQKKAFYDSSGKANRQHTGSGFGFDPFSGMGGRFSHFHQSNQGSNLNLRINIGIDLERACFGGKQDIYYNRNVVCSECGGKGSLVTTSISNCNLCGGAGSVIVTHGPLSISTTCPECKGKGKKIGDPCKKCNAAGVCVKKETIKDFEIPKGIGENYVLKLQNMGNFNEKGICGDLLIGFSYREHPVFKKKIKQSISKDYDVFFECYIPLHISLFGGKIKVPTLHGVFDLEIPINIKHGNCLILKGKGICKIQPDIEGDIGDQINIILIENPKTISEELKKTLLSIKDEEYVNYHEKVVTVAKKYEKNNR